MRRPRVVTAFVALALAACGDALVGNFAAGTWTGSAPLNPYWGEWYFTIAITQQGDSLKGDADATAGEFHEHYIVRGVQLGDSLRLRLMPVEDADINFAGKIHGTHFTGGVWFNVDSTQAKSIVLERQ